MDPFEGGREEETVAELEMQGFPVSFVKQMRLEADLEKAKAGEEKVEGMIVDDSVPKVPSPLPSEDDLTKDLSSETEGLEACGPSEGREGEEESKRSDWDKTDLVAVAGDLLGLHRSGQNSQEKTPRGSKRFSYKSFTPLNESDLSLIDKGKTMKGINRLPSGRYGARLYDNKLKQYKWIGAYSTPEEAFQARLQALKESEKPSTSDGTERVAAEGKQREENEGHLLPFPRYIGVDNPHPGGRFRARYKEHYLGSFDTPQEAAEAYDLALLKTMREKGRLMHGYVTLNFPDQDYSKKLDMEPLDPVSRGREEASPTAAKASQAAGTEPGVQSEKPSVHCKLLTSTDASGIRMVLPLPLADAIIESFNSLGGSFAGGSDVIVVQCTDKASLEPHKHWLVSMRDYRGKHANCRGNAVFVTGWRQVVLDMQLKAGDVIEFAVEGARKSTEEELQKAPGNKLIVMLSLRTTQHIMPNQPRRKSKGTHAKPRASPKLMTPPAKGTKRKYVSLQKLADAVKDLEEYEQPTLCSPGAAHEVKALDTVHCRTITQKYITKKDIADRCLYMSHKEALELLSAVPFELLQRISQGTAFQAHDGTLPSSANTLYLFVLRLDQSISMLKGDMGVFFDHHKLKAGQSVAFKTNGSQIIVSTGEGQPCSLQPHRRGRIVAQERYTFILSNENTGPNARLQIPVSIARIMEASCLGFWGGKQEVLSVRDEFGSVHPFQMVRDEITEDYEVREDWSQFVHAKSLQAGQVLHLIISGTANLPELVLGEGPSSEEQSLPAQGWETNVLSGLSPSLLGFEYTLNYTVLDPSMQGKTALSSRKKYYCLYRLKVRPISMDKGYGVTALEEIPAGRYMFDCIGEVISNKEAQEREAMYASTGQTSFMFDVTVPGSGQALAVKEGHIYKASSSNLCAIDCTKKGNVARLLNHSCSPNVAVLPHLVAGSSLPRLQVYSTRTIRVGEELTMDYHGGAHDKELFQQVPCHCGCPGCRGWLY